MDGVSRTTGRLGLAGSRKYRVRSSESLVSVKVLAGLVCLLEEVGRCKICWDGESKCKGKLLCQ